MPSAISVTKYPFSWSMIGGVWVKIIADSKTPCFDFGSIIFVALTWKESCSEHSLSPQTMPDVAEPYFVKGVPFDFMASASRK